MVTKQKQEKALSTPNERIFKLSLWQPPSTAMHRAGLAGLYMSLKHLTPEKGKVIDWELTPDSITLKWQCSDRQALSWLLANTYQIDEYHIQGLIKIPALGNISSSVQVGIHQGILNTFLQHGKSRTTEKVSKTVKLELGEDNVLELKYQAVQRYNYQDLGALKLYDKNDDFLPQIRIIKWVYPNASEKHNALGEKTKLQESPEGFISLLFAPIACSYYQVKSRLKLSKYRWALIIPHVNNLEFFAKIRQTEGFQTVSYEKFFASGIEDASLHYLMTAVGAKTADKQKLSSCEVWAFGDVPWSKQQKTNTARQTIQFDAKIIQIYEEVFYNYLNNGIKFGKNGSYISVSFGREIATENLVKGLPWYYGLHNILKFNTEVFAQLNYEKKNLHNTKEAMIEKGLTDKNATLFSDAVTWQLYLQLGEVAGNTSSNHPNFDRVKTKILMNIRKCRNQSDFSKLQNLVFGTPTTAQNPFLEEIELGAFYLWARENWQDCLSLMTLAIVGYKNPWKTERTATILEKKGRKRPEYLSDDESEDEFDESDTNEPENEDSEADEMADIPMTF